jgi:hypothetical protein
VAANSPHAARITDGTTFVGTDGSNPLDVQLRDVDLLLRLVMQTLGRLARDSSDRLRIAIDTSNATISVGASSNAISGGWASGTNLGVLTSACPTTSAQPALTVDLLGLSGVDPRWVLLEMSNQAFADQMRRNLTFS